MKPKNNNKTPNELLGDLFVAVQMQEVFEDGKTFVDCTAKYPYASIVKNYETQKKLAEFDLRTFVMEHFEEPQSISSDFKSDPDKTAEQHVAALWPVLKRGSDSNGTISYANTRQVFVMASNPSF